MASDGKWYPPAPPARNAGMNGCLKAALIAIAVAVVTGVGCVALVSEAADEATKATGRRHERIRADAEIVACRTGDFGWMEAQVRVTNNSTDRSNYVIEVAFESPDGAEQLGTGIAAVNALRSGQSTSVVASATTKPAGEFVCDIADVTRFSDEP